MNEFDVVLIVLGTICVLAGAACVGAVVVLVVRDAIRSASDRRREDDDD